MFGTQFYHETLRKYVIIFGTLFNDIRISRTDSNGNRVQDLRIPLAYGPRDKTLARLEQDPNLDREVAITLPRMSFEWIGLNYATERKLNTIRKNVYTANSNEQSKLRTMYNPVPYDITFELNIMSKYVEDSTRIIEQIVPYFTPEFTVSATIIPEMNWKIDIPVVLDAISVQDTYESDFTQRRAIIHTLTFTLKGQLFPRVVKTGIIKTANLNFYVDTNSVLANNHPANTVYATVNTSANVLHHRTTITPGLLSNGSPTTNSSLSIDKSLIDADDDYDYIINFEEFFDGSANSAS
jgi:hypothetical protein